MKKKICIAILTTFVVTLMISNVTALPVSSGVALNKYVENNNEFYKKISSYSETNNIELPDWLIVIFVILYESLRKPVAFLILNFLQLLDYIKRIF